MKGSSPKCTTRDLAGLLGIRIRGARGDREGRRRRARCHEIAIDLAIPRADVEEALRVAIRMRLAR